MRGIGAFALALIGWSGAAFAQAGPSFDCAKASNDVERTICGSPALATSDRNLSSLYATLLARLDGPARESLEKGQIRWIAERNRKCRPGSHRGAIEHCLESEYGDRIADMRAMSVAPYPFIEEQSIERKGAVGKATYAIDLRYPRFAGSMADFAAVNRTYADAATKAAGETTPGRDDGIDREQAWEAVQTYALYRPSPDAITVALSFWAYTGGAHGYGSTSCRLVNLRSGRSVVPGGVFAENAPWLREVVAIVGADLKKQFVERPGFEDALEPKKLTETVNRAERFCWQAGKLQIYFPQYEVGPYVAGPYTVDIPYSRLKPLLRSGGPIAP